MKSMVALALVATSASVGCGGHVEEGDASDASASESGAVVHCDGLRRPVGRCVEGDTCTPPAGLRCPDGAPSPCRMDCTCAAAAPGVEPTWDCRVGFCVCAGDASPVIDATTDAGDSCALVAGKCPSTCPVSIEGRRYDPTRACLETREIFGCAHGVDAPGVSRCRTLVSSGALYRFDGMEPALDDPAWTTCSDAERTMVTRYPPIECASGDGG